MATRSADRVLQEQLLPAKFEDFELTWQWKMTKGGNSGVIYRATEEHDEVWQSGPEYQILDNEGHMDGLNPQASAGACYAVFPPAKDHTRPVGARWMIGTTC